MQGNWYDIGKNDGTQGRALSYLKNHTKACQKHGVAPQQSRYEEGRNVGLKTFCTPLGGFKAGRRGPAYQNVCPALSEVKFHQGYQLGRQFSGVEDQLFTVKSDLTEIGIKLNDPKTKRNQTKHLQDQVYRLESEERRLNREINRLRYALEQVVLAR